MKLFQQGNIANTMRSIILLILIITCPILTANDLLEEIAEVINKQHIYKPTQPDFSNIIPNAVNEYLQTIDPYSKYLTATEYKQLQNNKIGIGAKIVPSDQGVLIIPFYQGPAFKAGINKPMLLLSVNKIAVKTMTILNIINLFKENDKIIVESLSNNIPHINTIIRQPYILPSVQVIKAQPDYIRINKFIARETTNELKKILSKKDLTDDIIIDLRETSGGDLYEALDCLSLFLPPKKLLITTINNNDQIRKYYSIPNQIIFNKITLLVGTRTASSAEVFAKALQYYQRATLIGQKTYGKCVSQTYIKLSDGSALKLTNLKLFYPDDTFCDGKGLLPDKLLDDKQLINQL